METMTETPKKTPVRRRPRKWIDPFPGEELTDDEVELTQKLLHDLVKLPRPELQAMLEPIPAHLLSRVRMTRIRTEFALDIAFLVLWAHLGRPPTQEEGPPIVNLLFWLLEDEPAPRDNEQIDMLCYAGRVFGRWTWPQVADYASKLALQDIAPATIRKRVERYADDNGLAAPRRYTRPPVTRRSKEGNEEQL